MGSVGTESCMSWKMNRAHKQTDIRMLKKEKQTLLELSRKKTNCAKTLSTVLCSNVGNSWDLSIYELMIIKEQMQTVPKKLAKYCAKNMGSVGTKACKRWKMNRAHNQTEKRMFKRERQTLQKISRKRQTVLKLWAQYCAQMLGTVGT